MMLPWNSSRRRRSADATRTSALSRRFDELGQAMLAFVLAQLACTAIGHGMVRVRLNPHLDRITGRTRITAVLVLSCRPLELADRRFRMNGADAEYRRARKLAHMLPEALGVVISTLRGDTLATRDLDGVHGALAHYLDEPLANLRLAWRDALTRFAIHFAPELAALEDAVASVALPPSAFQRMVAALLPPVRMSA